MVGRAHGGDGDADRGTVGRTGIVLPEVGSPMGTYVHAVRTGNLLYLAGKGPHNADGTTPKGKVGQDVGVEEAYAHARSVGLTLVAVLKQTLGDLDRVRQVVKVLGMVNAAPDFGAQPAVINGCSDLFVEISAMRGDTRGRRWAWVRCRKGLRSRSRRSSRWNKGEIPFRDYTNPGPSRILAVRWSPESTQ